MNMDYLKLKLFQLMECLVLFNKIKFYGKKVYIHKVGLSFILLGQTFIIFLKTIIIYFWVIIYNYMPIPRK